VRFVLGLFVGREFLVWERVDDVVQQPIESRFRLRTKHDDFDRLG
jgi:hypothetical protein